MHGVHEQTTSLLNQLQTIATHIKVLKDPRPRPPYYERAVCKVNEQVEQATSMITEELTTISDELSVPQMDFSDVPIGFEKWEAIAYELALNHTNPTYIADELGVTLNQLEFLQTNPYFAKMLQTKKDEVKSLGVDAAFTVKMRLIVNRATSQFLQRLTNPNTNSKDFHTLFKTAVELARLIPEPDTDVSPAVIGTTVTFNIQGVPGLEHLAQPLAEGRSVVDADFVEVKSSVPTGQPITPNELVEL